MQDLAAVQQQIDRQLAAFVRLVGSPPDHIDSHHHMHRLFNVARLFLVAGRRYNVPVRGFSDVVFVGRFWGQPEFGKTDLSKISVEVMVAMLRAVKPGVTEISCHPGHVGEPPRRDLQPRAGGGAADPDRRAGQEDDQRGRDPADQLPRLRPDVRDAR